MKKPIFMPTTGFDPSMTYPPFLYDTKILPHYQNYHSYIIRSKTRPIFLHKGLGWNLGLKWSLKASKQNKKLNPL